MELLFTGTRELLKGMWRIFDAFGHLFGFPMQEKKRRTIELPTYRGLKADKIALARDRRRIFNKKFKDGLPL